jgi:Flp pilus assembly protein TadD
LALLCLLVTLAPTHSEGRDRRSREPSEREIQRDLRFAAEVAGKGLWREALYRWRKVLRHRPDDPRLLNNIAVALEASGDFEGAREHYERALALEDADEEVAGNFSLFASAQALMKSDDDADASAQPAGGQDP